MATVLTMEQVESVINTYCRSHGRTEAASPDSWYELGPQLSSLADVYAGMIVERRSTIDIDTLSEPAAGLLRTWATLP